MIEREYASTSAQYYDAAYSGSREDANFWADVAESRGGPVLELGCGTGRVALEIARRGVDLYGLEKAEAILDVFRRKLIAEPQAVRERVRLFHGDMRTFRLEQKFALVVSPFRPLQHMLTIEDQLAAFSTARDHLEPGGIFGFDLFYPNFSSITNRLNDNIEKLEVEWIDSDGFTVQRFHVRERVDMLNQVIYGHFIFRTFKGSNLVQEEKSPLVMSYYTYPQVQLLLKMTGFEIAEEYGSFDRALIDSLQEMIILARAV